MQQGANTTAMTTLMPMIALSPTRTNMMTYACYSPTPKLSKHSDPPMKFFSSVLSCRSGSISVDVRNKRTWSDKRKNSK